MYRRTPILLRIVDSFFRHQLLFWSALVIVSGLTMTALVQRSKTFHASAMTEIKVDNVASALGEGDTNSWIPPSQKHIDRFNDKIKENQPGGFLDSALKGAHLGTPINVDPRADDPRYAMLQKNLSASPDSANQFSIGLTWDNQEETKNILDALQEQYIKEVGDDRSANSIATLNFLNSQIRDVTIEMKAAENALAVFKSSNGGQLSGAESAYNNQLDSLKSQLTDKQITLGASGRREASLRESLAQMKPMNIAEQTVSDQSPAEQEVGVLLAQREAAMSGPGAKTPQHPDIVALDAQIQVLQKEQRANAAAPENQRNKQTKLQDNPQYQGLKSQIVEAAIAKEEDQKEIQNLNKQIADCQALVAKIPGAQRQLADKTRAYSSMTELYNTLYKKRQDIQLTAKLDSVTASDSLHSIGYVYAMPTTGKTKLIAMLLGSLLLGCVVGVILIVLSEWSDHSLRYEGDAERLLGVPILAALPESAELRTSARRALSGGGLPTLPAPEGS